MQPMGEMLAALLRHRERYGAGAYDAREYRERTAVIWDEAFSAGVGKQLLASYMQVRPPRSGPDAPQPWQAPRRPSERHRRDTRAG